MKPKNQTDQEMYEIEIKVLDINREKTEERLIALGAVKIFDNEIHALYFDNADKVIRKNRGTFRLRREGDLSVLTYKTHVENIRAKVREENNVTVSDFDTMKAIIESLGFLPWIEMKKHRTTYTLDGLHFEFDKYGDAFAYIPEFLEIEGTDIEKVYTYAEMLGFRKQDCRTWDAVEVAEYYNK
jgi:predicted adenylyl cyclase CyaB